LTETEPPTTEIAAMHKRVILVGAFEGLAMVELPHTAHRSAQKNWPMPFVSFSISKLWICRGADQQEWPENKQVPRQRQLHIKTHLMQKQLIRWQIAAQ
jgi:hypothetical protein